MSFPAHTHHPCKILVLSHHGLVPKPGMHLSLSLFFFFVGLNLQLMEVPGLGVKSELQLGPMPQLVAILDP